MTGEEISPEVQARDIIVCSDTPENVAKVRREFEKKFPGLEFAVISNREEISRITEDSIPDDNVLFGVIIPEGKRVNRLELMAEWYKILNQSS